MQEKGHSQRITANPLGIVSAIDHGQARPLLTSGAEVEHAKSMA